MIRICGRVWRLLAPIDRLKLALVALATFTASLLDIIAIGLIGVIGALSVRQISQSGEIGNRTTTVLELLRIQSLSDTSQLFVIGISVLVLIILKSFFVYRMTRRSDDWLTLSWMNQWVRQML